MKTLILTTVISLFVLNAKNPPIGFLAKVKGKVLIVNTLNKKEKRAKRGNKVYQHNSIQTLKSGKAKLIFKNGTIINIAENTLFEVESYIQDQARGKSSSFKLFYGKIRSIVNPKKEKKMEVHTPSAIMGIRGTDFYATFDRHFKSRSTKSSVYTLNGKVSLRRNFDKEDKAVMVLPGMYSSISATQDGKISPPKKPQKTPQVIINDLEQDMILVTEEERQSSHPKNAFVSFINNTLNRGKKKDKGKKEEKKETHMAFVDNGSHKVETEQEAPKRPSLYPERKQVKKEVQKKAVVKTVPKKEPKNKAKAIVETKKPVKKKKLVAAKPKKKFEPKKIKAQSKKLFENRFSLSTWDQFEDWVIIQDIMKKRGKKSLVRIMRHAGVSSANKKRTKLTTLDALFYDKGARGSKLRPSKKVEKLTTRVFDENKKYKGAEIEFLVEPGIYYISVDSGPFRKVTIEAEKDITFKSSVLLSPGSGYYVYSDLIKTHIPFRDKGSPIFVLPSKYKISKDIKNKQGVITGKKKSKKFTIKGNEIRTPKF